MTLRFIVLKALHALTVSLAVSFAAFLLLSLAPEDPAEAIAVARYANAPVSEQVIEEIRKEQGLDAPLAIQYTRWLGRALSGDLGSSMVRGSSVAGEIAERVPNSLLLAALTIAASFSLAVPLAIAASTWARMRSALSFFSVVGVSVPGFLVSQLFILGFAVHWKWFPASGFADSRYVVLPVLSSALGQTAFAARLLAASLDRVLALPFIRVLRARGAEERTILWRHALPNALPPTIAFLGVQFALLLEGLVIVETVFAIPGVGRLVVEAAFARDFPVLQGCLLVLGLCCVGAGLLASLVAGWLDPRTSAT